MIATGQYAELGNGIRLHYASCGERGRPLMIFLHGFPEYWGAWEEVLPSFGGTHHAVAPDLRGFNLSTQPAAVDAYRAREIVGDLERLVAHFGEDRAIVVAHDWGGAVAWQWAIAKPERISKLIVLNSPHPIPFARALVSDPAQQQASAYMNWLRKPGSEDALARDGYRRLDDFFLQMDRPRSALVHGRARGPLPRGLEPRARRRDQLLPGVALVSADAGRSRDRPRCACGRRSSGSGCRPW